MVTFGAIFLIIAELIPKEGTLISTIPIEVLGGGVIVMFGTVAAAAVLMTSGLLPAAFIAIFLNLVLPEELADDQTNLTSGGLAGEQDPGVFHYQTKQAIELVLTS